MANAFETTLHDLGAETVSGVGESIDIGALRTAARFAISMVAFAGSGGVTLGVETSDDQSNWRTVPGVSGATLNNAKESIVLGLGRYLRATWALAGTVTSVSFSIEVEAHQIYANLTDLCRSEIPEKAIASVPDEKKIGALIDASCDAEDALASSNALPLTSWPSSLARRVSSIAVFYIMKHRGFQPAGFDELIVKAHDDAQKWLKDVAAGRIRPPGLAPHTRLGPQSSSGNPLAPQVYRRRMSDDFGSFG
jgi:phage gp36-like protein